MLKTIIFDLSEVFIYGMYGIERPLARILSIAEDTIISLMSGNRLRQLFQGEITEDQYFQDLLSEVQWDISLDSFKRVVRGNFHGTVRGMDSDLLRRLDGKYELIILSDHAREWVEYIKPIHQPLLSKFSQLFFSYDHRLQGTKKFEVTFQKVLKIIGNRPEECLFIDDRARNVEVAGKVGIPGIHFTDAQHLINEDLPQFGITLIA
ncbi:MAG: HAD-IA family hydrolase [bacterium]|nr:HAD-IA family hydrolase [bacterium]